MKHRPSESAGRLAIVALLLGLVGGSLQAQSCDDRASFEARLDLFVEELHQATPLVNAWESSQGRIFEQSVADFEAEAAGLDAQGREGLCELFERYPELLAAPGRIDSELSGLAPIAYSESSCLLLTRQQFLAVFISSQVLGGVATGLQTACDATACISGVCMVTCSLAGVANLLVLPLEAVLEENDYCGKDTHFKFVAEFVEATDTALGELESALQNQVIPPLDEPLSSRASQASLDLLRAGAEGGLDALSDRALEIEGDLATQGGQRTTFQEATLLQLIEANLRPGVEGRVSLLQLPDSVGGLLTRVREVVADTILASSAAGNDIADSLAAFDRADRYLNQQKYKAAFRFYRTAYRATVGQLSIQD